MNKCYWVYEYFMIDNRKIEYLMPYFSYGADKSKTITFSSFNELYDFVKNNPDPSCYLGSIIHKKRVYIAHFFDCAEYITEKNFSKVKISYIKEYKEFTPTIKQAIEYLNVEQFKEYAGFNKEILK